MIQLGDIFANSSNSDQNIREAVFDKVPREKIKLAAEVIENWQLRINEKPKPEKKSGKDGRET
jgi:hypothetical protein